MKTFDFHSVDMRVVQNKKKWFLIPLVVLIIAIIMGTVYGIIFNGAVFNVGVDFTGGYTLTVTLGTSLDDEATRNDYETRITDIIENPSEYSEDLAEMNVSGFTVRDISAQGEGADRALRIQFTAKGYSDVEMVGTNDEGSKGIIDYLSDAIYNELHEENDIYGVKVGNGDRTTATVSTELIITAVCGVLMSLALMLIYIAVRFELMSGFVALLCLVHDVVIMVLFMCIFHIEIASTFVAALITILGYSINNTIIIFDMIRDKKRTNPNLSPTETANISVRDTMTRSINTTVTTFITVAMIAIMSAIFSVTDLLNFCLPLMAGLIAGMFSSVLIAPSLWAMLKEKQNKKLSSKPLIVSEAEPVLETANAAPVKDTNLESFFSGDDDMTKAETTSTVSDNETAQDSSEPTADAVATPEDNAESSEVPVSDDESDKTL